MGVGTPVAVSDTDDLTYVEGSTAKVCRLTGDFDRSHGVPTLSQTEKRFGVVATDLGSSFEHRGKLYFLPAANDAAAIDVAGPTVTW